MRRPESGFTLVEVLVYLAIFSIAMGGLVEASYALLESADTNRTELTLQAEGEYLLGKIDYVLESAASVSSPGPGMSSSVITVADPEGSTVTIERSGTSLTYDGIVLNNSNTSVAKVLCIRSGSGFETSVTLSARTSNGRVMSWSASSTIVTSP